MNKSYWRKTTLPHFPELSAQQKTKNKRAHYDVVVVGGGITGILSAYFLKEAGKKVCLLERGRIMSGETGQTTAHLSSPPDLRISDLVSGFGEESARLVFKAGEEAITTIEALVDQHKIDCEFKRVKGFLHTSLRSRGDEAPRFLSETDLAHSIGVEASYVDAVPVFNRPGIVFENQAKFHPAKFLKAMAELIPGNGSEIYENSEVTKIDDDPVIVHCSDVSMSCDQVIIATHVPVVGADSILSAALFQTKIAPYSSYVLRAEIPNGLYPEGLFCDTSDPYYYLRVDAGVKNDFVIFGGRDHKTGQVDETGERFTELEKMLRMHIPEADIVERWSGQVIETHDGLPFIGEKLKNQFIATGFAGNGMTFGTISAIMARAYVLKRQTPWEEIFSPSRKEIHAGGIWDYLKENIDYPRYMVSDRLKSHNEFTLENIPKGEGHVLKVEGKLVACFRDLKGHVHSVSAYCTHLGGIVHFNEAEQTWDCPCHGSRFKLDGQVLGGPAETPLEKIKVKEEVKV